MHHDDFPEHLPSDRLGRMLVLSMVFHLALFGGLVWYNSRTSRLQPPVPTYTVDLVNMPLPAPGPKSEAAPESPAPGPPAKTAAAKSEKSGLPPKPESAPKNIEAKKLLPVEKKPVARVKPAPPPPPKPESAPPPHPRQVTAPPPKIAAKPAAPAPKPVVSAPKNAEPPAPGPAAKPAAVPKKVPAPRAVAEAKTPADKTKKSSPEAAPPSAGGSDAKAREKHIAQEMTAAQKKAAEASRDQQIKESIGEAEKTVAAKSRDQAYKDAVNQAEARLSDGKVSTKVSRGDGGSGTGGSMGSAQTAAYGAHVSQAVRRHWQPNCLQRSNMKNLKAVIIVRIMPDGTISASWFEKESGDRLFDQSAMTAVTRSSPLPTLPPGQEKLEIGITFTPEWKASS